MDNIVTPVSDTTTPTSIPSDVVPPITQEKSTSSSLYISRWIQVLLTCILVISVLSAAGWYGSKKYYQVRPLNVDNGVKQDQSTLVRATSSLVQNQSSSTTENVSSDYDLSSFTISESNCDLDSITSQDNKLSTTTLSYLKDELCALVKNQGKAAIKQSVKISLDGDTYNIATIIKGGVIESSGYTYLVSFFINDDKVGNVLTLDGANLLKINHDSKISTETIKNIAGEKVVIKVSGIDTAGNEIQEYFKRKCIPRGYCGFAEMIKNSDGTFSETISSSPDDVAHVTFLVPYSFYSSRLGADIDSFVDSSKNTITAYHKEGCGLENTYSDISFEINDFSTTIGINYGFSPILNVTTTRTGYDPSQWGKILEKISMADFRSSAQKPKARNSNSPTEIITLGEYQVKHVGPITPDRSCYSSEDGSSYDIYQAIKNGAVITFTVFNKSGVRDNLDEIKKLISQVLTTLTFSKR